MGAQIRCPQNRYTDVQIGLDQPLYIKSFNRNSLDATHNLQLGRYVNDSIHANCRMKVVINCNGSPILFLFATKDIAAGTELRYVVWLKSYIVLCRDKSEIINHNVVNLLIIFLKQVIKDYNF